MLHKQLKIAYFLSETENEYLTNATFQENVAKNFQLVFPSNTQRTESQSIFFPL